MTASRDLLREGIRQDDRRRESAVVAFLFGLALLAAAIGLLLMPRLGAGLSLSIVAMMGTLAAWYAAVGWRLRRGWFHPAVQWINVGIEVSVPGVISVLDTLHRGPEFALSAPPLMIWAGLVVLAGLRMRRGLALAAGILAGAQHAVVYAVVIGPALPANTLESFTPPFIAVRALLLAATGVITAMVAHQLLQKVESALQAVREQDLFGKYLLRERIGQGGMAEVFRATYSPEGGFEKTVAVKRILPAHTENETFVRLFRREAHLGSLLQHPNIVQILDLGTHEGSLFLAMEHVDGLTLRDLLKRRRGERLPLQAVAYVGAEVAAALDYIHARLGPDGVPLGLVHRDVNPPNVLLSRFGEVKLADFGVASAAVQETLSDGHNLRGKIGYMAPEQVESAGVDGRADLFALGLTLHEAITGKPAIEVGTSPAELVMAPLREIAPPSTFRDEVPPALDAAVMGLLERDRDARTATGADARQRLLSLPDEAAPLPGGRIALVSSIEEALAAPPTARASGPDFGEADTELDDPVGGS